MLDIEQQYLSDEIESLDAFFNCPNEVKYCEKCVVSNQRPSSTVEFNNKNKKEVINFNENNVCSACEYHNMKYNVIDWKKREQELLELFDKYRKNDGNYDVIVPGSGGKDSVYVAHQLKYKYGMHPLTVTWAPHIYTDIGLTNFDAWLNNGFDNVTFRPNPIVHKRLTRDAFVNIFHPFQPFILGQKQTGPKMALKYGIKLVMYGESPAETGSNIEHAKSPVMDPKFYSKPNIDRHDVHISGVSYEELLKKGMTENELEPYIPISYESVMDAEVDVHYMGYYHLWKPQDRYYYAAEHCGFKANPNRTEGTYSKYNSLDDKTDGFHYWSTFIKFGIGRATHDAAQEIRNGHLTREEGVALVNRYDGEFPKKWFKEFIDYMGITEEKFWEVANKNRSPHLWKKVEDDWLLRHKIK